MARMNIKKIYTIGYESGNIEYFLKQLKDNKVNLLIDTRIKTDSKTNVDFNKNQLSANLEENDIDYKHYIGLGTPPEMMQQMKETGSYSMTEYKAHLVENNAVLYDVISDTKVPNVAIMCYEANHKDCHRTVVAEMLRELTSAKVIHL